MLSGLMMQIAMQLGLHRPVQAEEFTTFRMEVQGEAMKDRLQTWVICNIVAQKYGTIPTSRVYLFPLRFLNSFSSVATGYGQPPGTIYDWALEPTSLRDADYHPTDDLRIRLRIEKFCDRVTKALYSSKPDPAEFISSEKLLIVQLLESELKDMEVDFGRTVSRMFPPRKTPWPSIGMLTWLYSDQHDPSTSCRATFAIFCIPRIQRSQRRLDETFHCHDIFPRAGS